MKRAKASCILYKVTHYLQDIFPQIVETIYELCDKMMYPFKQIEQQIFKILFCLRQLPTGTSWKIMQSYQSQ